MGDNVLIESIELGPVRLAVADMKHSLELYVEVLGLRTAPMADGWIAVGSAGHPIFELREEPEARPRLPHATGLCHVAILLSTRADLARVLRRLIDTGYPIEGAADHGVSEAIYLSDPEGNGIEIYRDRPRQEWPLTDGKLAMVTDPLDVDDLLAGAKTNGSSWSGVSNGTRVGHIHLQVGELGPVVRFHRDILGFDVMQHFGNSAAFLSVGGYHHHIGLNTWAGIGAPPPPAGTQGLRGFVVRLPSQLAVEAAVERMIAAGCECTQGDGFVRTHDPAGNALRLASMETEAQPG